MHDFCQFCVHSVILTTSSLLFIILQTKHRKWQRLRLPEASQFYLCGLNILLNRSCSSEVWKLRTLLLTLSVTLSPTLSFSNTVGNAFSDTLVGTFGDIVGNTFDNTTVDTFGTLDLLVTLTMLSTQNFSVTGSQFAFVNIIS